MFNSREKKKILRSNLRIYEFKQVSIVNLALTGIRRHGTIVAGEFSLLNLCISELIRFDETVDSDPDCKANFIASEYLLSNQPLLILI